jgi:hypothetical protein
MQIIETPHGTVQRHGDGPVSVVLAHGSGIGMAHEFMQSMAAALVAQNFSVYLFEFSYMQQIQKTGIKRPPPAVARLELEYLHLLQTLNLQGAYIIGGKSLGSRVASLVVERTDALAWLALGYPFHPQKKLGRLRVEHLLTSVKPGLIVQGTRDALGSYDEVLGYALPEHIDLHWLAHMDHSFKPYKASPYSLLQAIEQSAIWIEQWCQNRLKCNFTEVPSDEI